MIWCWRCSSYTVSCWISVTHTGVLGLVAVGGTAEVLDCVVLHRGLWVSWPLHSSDVWFWNRGHYLRKSWTCICVEHTYRRVSGAVKQHVHNDHHYVGCRHIPRCSNRCIVQFSSLSSSKAAVLMSSARFWTNSSLQRTSEGLSVGWLELLWARQDVVMEGNDDNCESSYISSIALTNKCSMNGGWNRPTYNNFIRFNK